MADEIKKVKEYRIAGGVYVAKPTDDSVTPSQAKMMLEHTGKEQKKVLRVVNGNETAIFVEIAAGDGPRAALGNLDIEVGASGIKYISLFDTARFMNLTTGEITVTLKKKTQDGKPGNDLDTELPDIAIEAIQL